MPSPRAPRVPPAAPASPLRGTVAILVFLAVYALLLYHHVLGLAFISDDYNILNKVRNCSFPSLWTAERPLWAWYRPVSRELHFWTIYRLFGLQRVAYHAASLALWIGVLAIYYRFGRSLMGARAAAIATAGVASLAAWAGTLQWASGSQELWMLAFALLCLHAFARRQTWGAAVAFLLALLSKETAGVLPGIALLYARVVDRDAWPSALRRMAPLLAVFAGWFVLHPFLIWRLQGHYLENEGPSYHPFPPAIAAKTVLSFLNLETWPRPEMGWLVALGSGFAAVVFLVAGTALALWREPSRDSGAFRPGRIAAFGLGWTVLGALPVFLPSVGWQSYYVLLAAFGAWLAVSPWMARRPPLALAVIAGVATLQCAHAATPSWEWGSDSYQRRSAFFVGRLGDDLLRLHPKLPPHSRLFFGDVPRGIGLGYPWFSAAFEVWYRDSTIEGGFFSSYRPRAPDEPPGRDYFFRYDDAVRWVEVVMGPEDVGHARERDPEWEAAHRRLALLLGSAGNWAGAAAEVEKLASASPGNPEYPLNLALCLRRLGNEAGARSWERRADSLNLAGGGVRPDSAAIRARR